MSDTRRWRWRPINGSPFVVGLIAALICGCCHCNRPADEIGPRSKLPKHIYIVPPLSQLELSDLGCHWTAQDSLIHCGVSYLDTLRYYIDTVLYRMPEIYYIDIQAGNKDSVNLGVLKLLTLDWKNVNTDSYQLILQVTKEFRLRNPRVIETQWEIGDGYVTALKYGNFSLNRKKNSAVAAGAYMPSSGSSITHMDSTSWAIIQCKDSTFILYKVEPYQDAIKRTDKMLAHVLECERDIAHLIFSNKLITRDSVDIDIALETLWELRDLEAGVRSERSYDRVVPDALRFYLDGMRTKATKGRRSSLELFGRASAIDSFFVEPACEIALYFLKQADSANIAGTLLSEVQARSPDCKAVLNASCVRLLTRLSNDSIVTQGFLDTAQGVINQLANTASPNDPRALNYQGVILDPYWREHPGTDIQKSRSFYLQAIARSHQYIRPLNNLVWSLSKELEAMSDTTSERYFELRGQLETGLSLLRGFIPTGLVDPRFLNTLADGYCNLGKQKEACEFLTMSERNSHLIAGRILLALERDNRTIAMKCVCDPWLGLLKDTLDAEK